MKNQETTKENIPVDHEALRIWMDGEGLETGPLDDVELLAGGTQNILLRFKRGGRDFVLRRPPPHLRKNSNKTMQREAQVLKALSGSNVPHPGFIASCDDETVLGVCFYLMEPVDGFNPANGLSSFHANDSVIGRRMGLSYIEGIAALGAVDFQSVGLEGFGKPEGFLKRQPSRWMGQLESYSTFDKWTGFNDLPEVETIINWLEKHMPRATAAGIIHGDCHLANTMFAHDSAELAALVDWELATIGDPLIDLGWVIATWPTDGQQGAVPITPWAGFPSLSELIDHYGNHSSRNLDAVSWYGVLACFKLGAILEGTHARASEGKAPKEIGDQLHATTIALFEKAHKLILEN